MSSWVLVLLLLHLWDRRAVGQAVGVYCMDQAGLIEASEGEPVTIPCSFSFPENSSDVRSMSFLVKAGFGYGCGSKNDAIYNNTVVSSNTGMSSTTVASSPRYQERLKGTLDQNIRKASITISNVTSEENNNYCCRVEITFYRSHPQSWENPYGTQLRVKDKNELRVKTRPVIYTFAGDNVTILSQVTKTNINSDLNITSCQVWLASGNTCDGGTYKGDCLITKNTFLFKLSQADNSDRGYYCWKVNISTRNGGQIPNTYLGPELQILGPTSTLNISQPEEVKFPNSTTINCSFTVQQEHDVLTREVYWMIGDPKKDYVYHPDADYIHPDYRGKTRLIDGRNLLLGNFIWVDNSTFYCRVMLRRCHGTAIDIRSVLEEGPGTLLRVIETTSKRESESHTTLIIAVCVGFVGLILFALLLFYLIKVRGDRRKHSRDDHQILAKAENKDGAYDNPEMFPKQEGDNLVYANMTHSAPSSNKKPKKPQEPDSDMVYAAGENLVYATVNHTATLAKEKPGRSKESGSDTVYAEVRKS